MTVGAKSDEDRVKVVWTTWGFANETIVVDDDDDVEAHGMLGVVAAAAIMAGSAGGAFIATAGTALAPEPAQLTQSLSATQNSVAAVYVSSQAPTQVRYMGTSIQYNPSLAVGTPCTTTRPLPAGAQTTQVVQAAGGSYRRCV